ncbi:MAG: hypothetical protein HFG81_10090 [Dorea sp.]|nr:hypothetical protein [Dorea sp.]
MEKIPGETASLILLIKSRMTSAVFPVLRQAFNTAMENGLCSGNPASKVTVPKNAAVKEVEALTPEEQERRETACRSLPLGHLIIFLDLTGLRRGELINLKWEDYDAEEGRLPSAKARRMREFGSSRCLRRHR